LAQAARLSVKTSFCRNGASGLFAYDKKRHRIVEGEGSIVKVGDQSYTRDATNVAPTSLPAARRDVRPVTMGTLVDGPSIRPTSHIFVGAKAPWFEITGDLPRYEGHAR
jgi:hypothetical protein